MSTVNSNLSGMERICFSFSLLIEPKQQLASPIPWAVSRMFSTASPASNCSLLEPISLFISMAMYACGCSFSFGPASGQDAAHAMHLNIFGMSSFEFIAMNSSGCEFLELGARRAASTHFFNSAALTCFCWNFLMLRLVFMASITSIVHFRQGFFLLI